MSKNPSFEEAYAKLEDILEKMTKSDVSLDNALTYYDEADKLLQLCTKKLDEAEKKIQILTKTRENAMALDSEGRPILKDFSPNSDQVLTRDENFT